VEGASVTASEAILRALETKERGDLKAAIAALEQAAALTPYDHYCHHLLSCWLREDGRVLEARALLETLVAQAPSPPALMDLASLASGEGDVARALELFRAVVEREPGNLHAATMMRQLQSVIDTAASRLDCLIGDLAIEHRHPAPYVEFTGRPRGGHADLSELNGQRLDDWGFPNLAPPSRDKPVGEQRVFVLGDSTMFTGADLGSTVPALLERALRDGGLATVRVYNFAVASACSTQMTVLLLLKLVELEPDLVVVCNGALDLLIAREYDPRPGYPYNFFMIEALYTHFFDAERSRQSVTRADFLSWAAAAQLKLRAQVGWLNPAWEQEVVDVYLRGIDTLGRIATTCDIETVLLLEPMVVTRDPPTADERSYLKPATFAFYSRQYERIRSKLFAPGRPADRYGPRLTVHDGSLAFADQPATVYRDYIHFNSTGSRLMAAHLAAIVRDRLGARRAGVARPPVADALPSDLA
jgi:lysophospholipase L1-like esterase